VSTGQRRPEPRSLSTIGDQLRARGHQGGEAQTPASPPGAPPPAAAAGDGPQGSAVPPDGVLPLPETTARRIRAGWTGSHPALAFEKFVFWPSGWQLQAQERRSPKLVFLECFAKAYNQHPVRPFYEGAVCARRLAFLEALRQSGWVVRTQQMKTSWRMVSGLGMSHPFETGFVFDRSIGVPYLPGSSLKGAARAWALAAAAEDADVWRDRGGPIEALFGPRGDSDGSDETSLEQGGAMFLDVYPTKWPVLEVDILNPHYKEYYDSVNDGSTLIPPADYLSPTPIYFLTVAPNQPFEIAVAVRKDLRPELLEAARTAGVDQFAELALAAATGAARDAGLGGKTAVGYGYLEEVKG